MICGKRKSAVLNVRPAGDLESFKAIFQPEVLLQDLSTRGRTDSHLNGILQFGCYSGFDTWYWCTRKGWKMVTFTGKGSQLYMKCRANKRFMKETILHIHSITKKVLPLQKRAVLHLKKKIWVAYKIPLVKMQSKSTVKVLPWPHTIWGWTKRDIVVGRQASLSLGRHRGNSLPFWRPSRQWVSHLNP